MINFCITNKPKLVNDKHPYKKYLKHGIWLYYDSGVKVIDLPQHVIVFCGILWEGKITDFLKNVKQNGIFYAIVISKVTGKVQVINDMLDSFFLNYYVSGKYFVVTNEIKAYSSSLGINYQWVNVSNLGVNLMDAPSKLHPDLTLPTKFQDVRLQNITPLKGVKYLGAGQVLTLQNVEEQITCSCHTYFSYNDDIGKLFSEKPKHDYKSALDTAKRIIRKNCERIKEKYGTQLIHFCSTGVDSLVLQSYLDDVPMYGFYSKQFNAYNESTELFEQLYSNNGGTLHRFDSNKILNIINRHLDKLQKTIDYKPVHLMFMHMKDQYELNDCVMIQGNAGDHTFCHDRHYVLRHAVHQWNVHDAEQIWNRCLPHYGFGGPSGPIGTYSKESRINEMNEYISNPCKDFATSMMQLHYFKRLPSLTGQYMPNQLMIDPYADLRLIKLLPTSDVATQEASILNAQIQKDIISDKFKPYLNSYVAGTHWFYDRGLNNIQFKKKMIDSLIRNLQARY